MVEAIEIFIKQMNDMAQKLKMHNTTIKNPSGLSARGQLSTTYDIALLTLHASQNQYISEIWRKKEYQVDILGEDARQTTIKTTIENKFLSNYYTLLGGKTGTLGIIKNLTAIVYEQEKQYIVVTIGAQGNRFHQTRLILDYALKGALSEDIQIRAYTVMPYPSFPIHLSNHTRLQQLLAYKEHEKVNPASIIKLLTILTALTYPITMEDSIVIEADDIVEDALNALKIGDIISVNDALHLMLLASSNIAAQALARFVGQKSIK